MTRRTGTTRRIAAPGILLISLWSAAGARATAQQLSEGRIQELIREAAVRAARPSQPALSGQTPGATPARIELTLDEAVKLALDRNVDIVVQRLNPPTFDLAAAGLVATYMPVVTSTVGTQTTVTPSTTTTSGAPIGSGISSNLATYSGTVYQNVKWGGGTATLALNNTRATTTSATALFDPVYNPNWSAQYTQPLVRGLTTDANRQQLAVTRINRDISDLQLQSTVTNTLSTVREAYWNYVYTTQVVEVARESLQLAEQLVEDNRNRVEIGTLAGIDVVTAQSQAAQQKQALVQAEANLHNAELALKRLIVGSVQDPAWNATLDPVDRPAFDPEPIDVPAAIRRALSARTDLAIGRKTLEADRATLAYLRDQARPQADLVARYGVVGLGGTEYITTGSGITRQVIGTVPGGFSDALSSLFTNRYPTWSATVNISYPLGTNVAAAATARGRIQVSQMEAQLRQTELQVATDVTSAAINVESAIESVQAAKAAQELAQQTNDAEQAKFEVGVSTNYNVILTQRDLNTAKNSYLQAVLNYRNALVELDRVQQTTLQAANVTIVNTLGLNTYSIGSGCLFTGGYPCS